MGGIICLMVHGVGYYDVAPSGSVGVNVSPLPFYLVIMFLQLLSKWAHRRLRAQVSILGNLMSRDGRWMY
jgi:hypothetical protein